MAKKFKKTQKPCQSHLFSLKPGSKHNSSARSLNLTLSFCSRNVDTPADVQDEIKCIEAPIYNDDRSFASPAFTLPSDKVRTKIVRFITCSDEIKCWISTS
jgi:hypothetical protein